MLVLRKILLLDRIFISILVISLLYAIVATVFIKYKSHYTGNEKEFEIKVTDYLFDGNKLKVEGKAKEKIILNYRFESKEEKEYFETTLGFGDILKTQGELSKPKSNTIPNGFNYKKYLYNNSIFYIVNAEKIELTRNNSNFFYKIKSYFYNVSKKYNNKDYIYAYILGNTNFLDEDVKNSYRSNGISHLFALSGLHVNIFALIILYILKLFKVKEFIKYIIVFIILIFFSFITGFSPSILRAVLLFFLLGVNKTFNFYVKTENIFYIVASTFILINPFNIYNISFQLSYVVTYFLIISIDLIKGGKLITSLYISIISFLASLPIITYNFASLNLLGIIYNLIFVPYVSIIVFPTTIITFIFPLFENVLSILLLVMEYLSIFLSKITILEISIPKMNLFVIFLYYIVLLVMIKYKKKKAIYLIFGLVGFSFIKPYVDNNTYIYFTDVGQGDSTLIVTKNKRHSILIDTGGSITYEKEFWEKRINNFSLCKNTLIPFYKSIGLTKIDYLIITHGDADHVGEALCLQKNYNITKTYINMGEVNELERNLLNYTINIEQYKKIDEVELFSLNSVDYKNENNNGIVLLVKIYDLYFLLMADVSKNVEEDIIQKYDLPNVTVLKVAHHGSKTSTSEKFISKVNPKYSIISAAEKNKFNHPHQDSINTLQKYKSEILYTMYDGTIKFKINNKRYIIQKYSK